MEAKMITLETIKPNSISYEPSKMDVQDHLGHSPQVLRGGKADRLTAHDVVEKIRVELRHLDDEIRDHKFLRMLRQKKVDLPTLRAFPGHQYHITNSDVRSLARMIHRFSEPSIQSFFVKVFQRRSGSPSQHSPSCSEARDVCGGIGTLSHQT